MQTRTVGPSGLRKIAMIWLIGYAGGQLPIVCLCFEWIVGKQAEALLYPWFSMCLLVCWPAGPSSELACGSLHT